MTAAGHVVEVDARGLACPLPALRAGLALKGAPRALAVLVSTGAARDSVVELLEERGYDVEVARCGGDYQIDARR